MAVEVLAGFIYTTYRIKQFYDRKKVASYVKALLSYLPGMIVFILVFVLLGCLD
jgi:hypothetical protein